MLHLLGFVNCVDNQEKQSIINFLNDISFLGHFKDDNCIFNNSNVPENLNIKLEKECLVKCESSEEKNVSEDESSNIKSIKSPNIDKYNGSDFDETVETSDQENVNILKPKRKKRKPLGSRISLKLRLKQYSHLMEFKSNTICKVGTYLFEFWNEIIFLWCRLYTSMQALWNIPAHLVLWLGIGIEKYSYLFF